MMAREWWRKRDGTTVFIDEMESSHLINAIRMLERIAKAKAAEADAEIPYYETGPCFNGTDASDLFLRDQVPYEAMCSEARRRGLTL